MKMKVKFFYFSVILAIKIGFSQNGKITNYIYEGNKNTQTEAFIEAEKSYRKALSLSPEKPEALYNLGNAHFLDKQYDEASQRFFQTQKFATTKETKHLAFHNMGNVYMQKKEYKKAVEAYKNGLRNNPADEETRYNYALAKKLLENENPPEEQEEENKKNQKNQKEKDKNQQGDQENKDEQDPEKEGDEGDQENKDKGEPKKEGNQRKDKKENEKGDQSQQQNQSPKEGQLSPQQVQSLLEAMNNQEKKVQDKVNAKKVKGVPVRGKKDW
jgi:outer membrane protein assembly factor BamD (BamD/ComL family)